MERERRKGERKRREAFLLLRDRRRRNEKRKNKKKQRTVDLAEHAEHRLGVRMVEEPDRRVTLVLLKGN